MKIIKPYFKFEDERGSIKGIINKGNWEEINYIFSKGLELGIIKFVNKP